MTKTDINKSISYQTDIRGKKTAVVFDLKNKAIQELVEDIMDMLTIKERLHDERVDFFEATEKLLSTKK